MDYTQKIAALDRHIRRYDDYRESRELMEPIFGEIVKESRSASAMSLRKFAVVLGVSPSFLSKVERGHETLPPEVARRILDLHR